MAMTLAKLAQLEIPDIKRYIILNIIRHSKLMSWLPFENVSSLKSVAIRWQTLPDVAWRGIGGSYTESSGEFEQVWESVYGFGGEILWDRIFEKVKNTVGDWKRQVTDQKLMAMSFKFNDYFINGDHAVDPLGIEGLKKRIAGMPARQTVYFAASNAAALDVTASTANARTFFDSLETMAVRCGDGPKAFLVNEAMYLGLGRAARYLQISSGGWLDTTKDTMGRDIVTFKGVPLIDVGFKEDQSTEIITDTETAGDSGADATSIYAVAFGDQQGVTGIQLSELEAYDPNNGGEMSTQPAKQLRIEWWMGLASFGSYGMVRGANCEGASQWT